MIIRRLILAAVLFTNLFAQNIGLNSSAFPGGCQPPAIAAPAKETALERSGFDGNYKLSLPRPVQDKNFYLLSLFQRNPSVRSLLSQNKSLKQLAAAKASALK